MHLRLLVIGLSASLVLWAAQPSAQETSTDAPTASEAPTGEQIAQEAIDDVLSADEAEAVQAATAGSSENDAPMTAAEETELEEAAAEAQSDGAVVENLDALSWAGAWRSFWRNGQALMTIQQDGAAISGTYLPGDGEFEGTLDGVLMRGTWRQAGTEGTFEFAMAPDGQSFVGRFANGEYWNGVRLAQDGLTAALFGQATPQAAFSSFISADNAASSGDALAEILIRRFLSFGTDGDTSARAQNTRIETLLELVNIATFRLLSIPETGENGEASVDLRISGTEFSFPLTLVEGDPERWTVSVPTLEELASLRADILEATGAATLEDLYADRQYSPRQAIHDFLRGTATWAEGGDTLALETLDLSEIPENLRTTDGPIAAEYLLQIIDRLGQIVWQEVPNDPNRRQPLLLYENVGGKVELESYPQEDGSVRWLFTADSITRAPDIFQVMQNLPIAEGVQQSEPLTSAFALRTQIKDISPNLLKREVFLENWQWLAIGATVVLSIVGAWLISRVLRFASRAIMRARKSDDSVVRMVDYMVGWPIIVFMVGGALILVLRRLGLRQDVSEIANVFASALLVVGGTYFFYYLVTAVTNSLARSARETSTNIDDIAAVIGGGVAKIGVLVGGVIILAELLSLPYEGVIAALGVGGLAFGFAARDAVANFIGAGMLMADRPFKKDDFVNVGGVEGTVEEVGMRSTRLRTLDDAVVTIPNAQIAEGLVNNMGQRRRRRVSMTLGVTYDTPRGKLEEFVGRLRKMLEENELVLPGQRVALDNFGASSIDIDILAYLRTPALTTYVEAKHKLIGDIVDLAAEVGVEFAFPSQTVYLANDNPQGFLQAAS